MHEECDIGWEQNRRLLYVPDEAGVGQILHLIVGGDDAPSIRSIREDLGHGQDAVAFRIDVVS